MLSPMLEPKGKHAHVNRAEARAPYFPCCEVLIYNGYLVLANWPYMQIKNSGSNQMASLSRS